MVQQALFWSLRAVIIALYCVDRINLWQAPSLFTYRKNDFLFRNTRYPSINYRGESKSQEVSVIFREDYTQQQSPLTRRLEKQTRVQKSQKL